MYVNTIVVTIYDDPIMLMVTIMDMYMFVVTIYHGFSTLGRRLITHPDVAHLQQGVERVVKCRTLMNPQHMDAQIRDKDYVPCLSTDAVLPSSSCSQSYPPCSFGL